MFLDVAVGFGVESLTDGALGWWILTAVLLVGAVITICCCIHHSRKNRKKYREAIAEPAPLSTAGAAETQENETDGTEQNPQ